jgi:hypothetical protein
MYNQPIGPLVLEQLAAEQNRRASELITVATKKFVDTLLKESALADKKSKCTDAFRSLVQTSLHMVLAGRTRRVLDDFSPPRAFEELCFTFSTRWAPTTSKPLSSQILWNYLLDQFEFIGTVGYYQEPSRDAASSCDTPKSVDTVYLESVAAAGMPQLAAQIEATTERFGIPLSDIRTTGFGVFCAAHLFTGVDWRPPRAFDPCPWPVPEGFDGLRDDWLPRSGKSRRVFLNPPFSRCDEWIDKAEKEHKQGVEILAVVSAQWIKSTPGRHKLLTEHANKLLWQAEFFMPSSRYPMDPLDVYLLWFIPRRVSRAVHSTPGEGPGKAAGQNFEGPFYRPKFRGLTLTPQP